MLKKGTVLNPKGRPVGAVNKSTMEIRQAFQQLVENNLKTMQADLSSMEPEKRVSFVIKLSEFILPKLAATSLDIDFSNMSEESIDAVIKQLNINEHE